MSSQAVVLRFPNGTEFVFTSSVPNVGDILSRGKDRWEVVETHTDENGNPSVTLRLLAGASNE